MGFELRDLPETVGRDPSRLQQRRQTLHLPQVRWWSLDSLSRLENKFLPALWTFRVWVELLQWRGSASSCRVASGIFQFKDGLNSCGGLWDVMESHWEMFAPVMTGVPRHPLTRPEFQQLFVVCYSQPEGSLRTAEEATVGHWETALDEVRGGNGGMEQ